MRKLCFRCKERPIIQGSNSWCRECKNAYARERRTRNIDAERARAMGYYYAHPERHKAHGRKYREAHPERVAAWHRAQYLRERGFREGEYEKFYAAQGGVCGICKRTEPTVRLYIDHDHRCHRGKVKACKKCIRGLLCHGCNRFLAWYEKQPEAIVSYLERRP